MKASRHGRLPPVRRLQISWRWALAFFCRPLQLVEYVGRLVYPVALVARLPEDLEECFPEAQGAVTHRQPGSMLETPGLQVGQHLQPALLGFVVSVLNGQERLWPCSSTPMITRMHCRASSARMVKYTPSTQISTSRLPCSDRRVQRCCSSSHCAFKRLMVRGIALWPAASTVRRRLLEVSRGDPLEVQPRDQLFQALRPAQVGWQ